LERQWRQLAGQKIRSRDMQSIGKLDDEQVLLPRRGIKEIIATRRTDNYIYEMKQKGKEIVRCQNCGRAYEEKRGHQCFSAPWKAAAVKNGLPAERRVVISQTGSGNVQIGQQTMLDPKKLQSAFNQMKEHQQIQKGKNLYRPMLDDDMEVVVEGGVASNEIDDDPAPQVIAANQIYVQENRSLAEQQTFRYGEDRPPWK
jgi:hypothetical protein